MSIHKKLALQFIRICTFSACLSLVFLSVSNLSFANTKTNKTILVLGDSLSAEYGIARGSGWVALLEKRLQEQKIPVQIINASISGETSSGGKNRLASLLQKHQVNYLIIELGGNDALRGLDLASVESNFRIMLEMAKKNKSKVLLVGMKMPPNYGRNYSEAFFNLYGKLSREYKTGLTPFMLEGVAEKPEYMQADKIHFTARAHPIILDNIWRNLQPMLK
jgi:acyl-CoA thioesterase-1